MLDLRLTGFAAVLSGQVRQGRLRPTVPAERVAVLGRDVRRERRRRGQVASVLALHGFPATSHSGQEGVAEQLTQQGILGEVVQELGEMLQDRREIFNTSSKISIMMEETDG